METPVLHGAPARVDVTDRVQAYRDCVRHLWNAHLLGVVRGSCDAWNVRDTFDDVCGCLFSALVLCPLGASRAEDGDARVLSPARAPNPQPLPGFTVVPMDTRGTPVCINRDDPPGGYWDYPIPRLRPSDCELELIRLFDFDELSFRDFAYYLVRVRASDAHPEIIGRHALIECQYATVHLEQPTAR